MDEMNEMNNTFPMRQNYGDYNTNIPMKTFAGQPAYVTMGQFDRLSNRVEHIEDDIHKNVPHVACGQCPKTMDECKIITDPMKREHCMASYDACKKKDCYSMMKK